MSNLANGKVILKHCFIAKKFLHCIVTLFKICFIHSLSNNFTPKNCLFDTVKLTRDADKGKFTYNGWEKNFWSFDNDTARNVIIFGVDNSSSAHTDNPRNFLVLSKGPTEVIDVSVGAAEKKFSINFSKANTKFYLSLHYNGDEGYL